MPPQQLQGLPLQPEQPSQHQQQQPQQLVQPPEQLQEQEQEHQQASGPAAFMCGDGSRTEAADAGQSGVKEGQPVLQRLTDDIAHASLTDDKQ